MRIFQPENSGVDPVLTQYERIRSSYSQRANDTGNLGMDAGQRAPLLSSPWMYQEGGQAAMDQLQMRYGGFDKLFLTLVQGIVEDPDYALTKDPRIYERMMRDPQIYYCLNVRRTATSSLPWSITPPDEFSEEPLAQKLADESQNRINRMPKFREFLDNNMNSLLSGLAVNELVWKVDDDGQYIIAHHYPMTKDRFKFDRNGEMTLLQPMAPNWGKIVPPYKFVAHRFQASDGSWNAPMNAGYVFYGKGLADTPLYHYFYFKLTALRFMLKNLERNASPFKIYYTGPQNNQLASKLDQILAALQNDSVVGIPGSKGPGGTEVQVESAKGGAELYIGLIEYIDRLITRAILGQELMTEMPSVGSYAAAQVHASVFARISENDRTLLQDTLNATLMRYDAGLNSPGIPEKLRPIFRFKSSQLLDIQQFLSSAQLAMSMGLELSENQVRELSGFRKPLPNEPILNASMMAQQQQTLDMEGEQAAQGEQNKANTAVQVEKEKRKGKGAVKKEQAKTKKAKAK